MLQHTKILLKTSKYKANGVLDAGENLIDEKKDVGIWPGVSWNNGVPEDIFPFPQSPVAFVPLTYFAFSNEY